MEVKTVGIACDHAGFPLKQFVLEYLEKKGYPVKDFGTYSSESVDYPDFAKAVSNLVLEKKADFGVLICGTGIGISIAANKINGIRAALCTNEICARLSREHNNANIIAFGARVTGVDLAKSCLKAFLNAEFEGGRHSKRVDKMEGCCISDYDI